MAEKFSGAQHTERDVVALGIALAAILLFVGTGGTVLPRLVQAWRGLAENPDVVLTNTLLLNIAVIIFGWARYKDLQSKLRISTANEEEARKLADIDPLTGCYNRRSLPAAMEELLETARLQDKAVAVLQFDLDNFKQINDVNGHTAGDEVLKVSADRIADILPADALLARLGGDEFACAVAFKPAAQHDIERLATQFIAKVSDAIRIDEEQAVSITMSLGMVSSDVVERDTGTSSDAQQLLHKADIAMYHAKKHGKNRFFWFEPAMEYELKFRNELENGIRKGMDSGEFVPYYEQQIDLETGELVGFEMLARWHSSELGMVGPDIFIPIAEEIGAIGELSEGLIGQAFEDAKTWNSRLTLSVNISPVQLRDPWFSQKLLKMLVQHNFPASRLEIEITESCLHEDISMVRTMVTSLRNQGVRISLDDFGTGYSSLSQLKSLPFDRLKIDRSFIRELKSPGSGEKLVDAIIAMGDGLDMPVTAEGIEDEHVLKMLRRMGPLKGQGYHYGRPETAAQVVDRLAACELLADAEGQVAAIAGISAEATPRRSGTQ